MSRPKTLFENYYGRKNSPFGFPKNQSEPKIKTQLNVRIEGNLKNKSCCTL